MAGLVMSRRTELPEFKKRHFTTVGYAVSRVYREILMEGITTHCGQRSGRLSTFNEFELYVRMFSRSVQYSLASVGYENRKLLLGLLIPLPQTQRLTWDGNIVN